MVLWEDLATHSRGVFDGTYKRKGDFSDKVGHMKLAQLHTDVGHKEQFPAYLNMESTQSCFEFYPCLPPGRVNRTLVDLLFQSKIGNR